VKSRGLFLAVTGCLAALAWPGLAGATVLGAPDRLEAAAPPSYRGTWYGTTAQGGEVAFTVDRRNRITRLELSFAVAGEGCTAEVEKVIRGAVATIRRKAFRVVGETARDRFTLVGRFPSATRARGTLTASVDGPRRSDGCSGRVSTTWRAKKGAGPPAVDRSYDGSWSGPVTLPPGLDPALVDLLDPTISFEIGDGAVTRISVPWIIAGPGCFSILVDGLEETLEPPVRLSGRTFSVSRDDTSDFAVEAAFDSPASASGTLVMSGSLGGFGAPPCTGSLEASWQATKQ
jgi:hypothetical protein